MPAEISNDQLNKYKFGLVPNKGRLMGERLSTNNTRARDESKIRNVEQIKINREIFHMQNQSITGDKLDAFDDRGKQNKPSWSFSRYLNNLKK